MKIRWKYKVASWVNGRIDLEARFRMCKQELPSQALGFRELPGTYIVIRKSHFVWEMGECLLMSF